MIRHFEGGDIATNGESFATGKEATRQGVIRRLRLFLGEYFLDATTGTPWFQGILGKTAQGAAEASLKQRIITSPGVVGIVSFTFDTDPSERRITVNASVLDVNNEALQITLNERVV